MVVLLVLSVLFSVAGYQEAKRFAKEHGRTPWGWDPALWAGVMFLSWVIGLILLAIAERQGRSAPRPVAPASHGDSFWPTATTSVAGFPQAGAFPQAAYAVSAVAAPAPAPGQWAADPTGRHQHRWFDGASWTPHVSTNGVQSTDPL